MGINVGFIGNERVVLHQREYLKECIADFGEDISMKVTTPAQWYLFDVDDIEKLDKDKHIIFHSIVQKILFVAKGSQPDLQILSRFYVQEYII